MADGGAKSGGTGWATARDWLRQLAILIAGAGTMAAIDMVAPSLIARQAVRSIALEQGQALQSQIVEGIGGEAGAPLTDRIARADSDYIETVARAAGVTRLAVLSKDGRAIWGAMHGLGGAPIKPWEARDILLDAARSRIMTAEIHTEDGGSRGEIRLVRTVVPMFNNGDVAAVIFTERDVTTLWNGFSRGVRGLLLAISAGGMVLILALSVLTLRDGHRRLSELRHRSDHERRIIDEQIRLGREVRLLGDLNEWLQSSQSLDELFRMVTEFMGHLLPDSEGSLYVYANSRDALDGCTSWNGATLRSHIHPEECWGLRRGRAYAFGQGGVEFACAHAHPHDGRPYVCFPILAHGETIGLLHVQARAGVDAEAFFATRRLAQMLAEQISLAIANVRMRDQLQDQSVRDPLTGLFNRRHLTETMRRLLARSTATRQALCILSIDVDFFKKFNDTHGHDAGDMVLRSVGSLLDRHCDGDQVACRLGGEEFMVLLPDTTADRALQAAESLRLAAEAITVRYGEKALPRITISIGVALAPVHGTMATDLMRVADDALYAAKAAGRNRVVLAALPGEDDYSVLTAKAGDGDIAAKAPAGPALSAPDSSGLPGGGGRLAAE
jgi:diguanylate cyclase (GGDEF)-like protein